MNEGWISFRRGRRPSLRCCPPRFHVLWCQTGAPAARPHSGRRTGTARDASARLPDDPAAFFPLFSFSPFARAHSAIAITAAPSRRGEARQRPRAWPGTAAGPRPPLNGGTTRPLLPGTTPASRHLCTPTPPRARIPPPPRHAPSPPRPSTVGALGPSRPPGGGLTRTPPAASVAPRAHTPSVLCISPPARPSAAAAAAPPGRGAGVGRRRGRIPGGGGACAVLGWGRGGSVWGLQLPTPPTRPQRVPTSNKRTTAVGATGRGGTPPPRRCKATRTAGTAASRRPRQ